MKHQNSTRKGLLSLFLILSLFTIFSCRKEVNVNKPETPDAVFPITDKEKQRVEVLKEVASILKEVYKKPKAYYEVNATIYSGYYEDETVLLKDLLTPQTSALYQTEKFKSFKAFPGEFKKEFFNQLNKADYPELKKAMGYQPVQNNSRIQDEYVDTSREIFSNSYGASIYFPYSEDFGSNFTPAYFDNINTDPFGNLATVIPADREADSAPGEKPYRHKTYDENGELIWEILYDPVTVDDGFAEIFPVHIVGVGVEPARILPVLPPIITAPTFRVFHGWSRLTHQYDKLISFTGNGGGSEVKVQRISGYLQFQNQQVTSFAGDLISVDYKRKEINKKYWKRVYGVWDPDWKVDNLEQVYAAWEDDTQGTKTFSGSLSTTLRDSIGGVGVTVTGQIGFSIQVITQDELITQRKQDRYSYFRDALNDQGWGFQMCQPGWCGYDDTFLPANTYWPKYDEGTNWGYTWPYKVY
jgi:hypothetical protein